VTRLGWKAMGKTLCGVAALAPEAIRAAYALHHKEDLRHDLVVIPETEVIAASEASAEDTECHS
jgi:hypothetical protein